MRSEHANRGEEPLVPGIGRDEDSVVTSVWGDKTAGTLSLGRKEQSSAEQH
jgi:hypothetical protein